jgi:chemotaxis signal transduction protein
MPTMPATYSGVLPCRGQALPVLSQHRFANPRALAREVLLTNAAALTLGAYPTHLSR